jgi:hypothetical protein
MSGIRSAPAALGKYQIRGVLGRDAMGTVYDGWDPVIGRRVAIKTVRLLDPDDAEAHDAEQGDHGVKKGFRLPGQTPYRVGTKREEPYSKRQDGTYTYSQFFTTSLSYCLSFRGICKSWVFANTLHSTGKSLQMTCSRYGR